jgi:PAS domain S-box-containing protein
MSGKPLPSQELQRPAGDDSYGTRYVSAPGAGAAIDFFEVVDNLNAGACLLEAGKLVFVNREFLRLLRYESREQLMQKPLNDFIHPADRGGVDFSARTAARGASESQRRTFRMLPKGGEPIWVNSGCRRLARTGKGLWLADIVDITRLKSNEALLKDSAENYRRLLDQIEDGYTEVDLAGNYIYGNAAFCNIFGVSRDRIIGSNYRDYVDADSARPAFEAFNAVYRTGIPNKSFLYDLTLKDGSRKTLEYSISLRKDLEGAPVGFRSIVRDVTDRIRAEEDLMAQRSRLAAIFSSVNDAIITVDNGLKVIEANQAARNICGLDVTEMTGRILTGCPGACDQGCHEVLLETLQRKRSIRGYQVECNRTDRPLQRVNISSSPLINSDNEFIGAVLVIRDITRLSELERELKERHRFQQIVGRSPAMQKIYRLVEDLADLETTVLITGESGTGKELVAKALHRTGNRSFKPFVEVNCSALAENLLESELFGHVRGAFTGAVRDARGRFQTANGGTLLLDEIGDISPRIQLKLLRVLQEKEFERVGESTPIKVDVRVIASTNKNLKDKVAAGEFREDLYYRLKVVEIELPPLRERLEDIPLLVEHFRGRFNRKFDRSVQAVADGLVRTFMSYTWPGNVRELEHTIERAFVLCRGGTLTTDHIPDDIRHPRIVKRPLAGRRAPEDRSTLEDALKTSAWNVSKAARLLGISRRTMYRRLREHRLRRPPQH